LQAISSRGPEWVFHEGGTRRRGEELLAIEKPRSQLLRNSGFSISEAKPVGY
jgi:hypothetical protein